MNHYRSRWIGDYGGKIQLYFPSNYVEEVSNNTKAELKPQVTEDVSLFNICSVRADGLNKISFHIIQQDNEDNPLGGLCKGVVEISKCNIQNCK